MDINGYLSKDNVFVMEAFKDKSELISFLCKNISDLTRRDNNMIINAVLEREEKISTGIGMGIAVPHGRIKGWGDTSMSFLLLKEPMEYGSLDGAPVRFVILFVSDRDRPCEHVNILSKISYILAEGDNLDKILNCSTPEELYETILSADKYL